MLPAKSSVIVWSSAKVTPFAISTVSVELSPSAISSGSADTVNSASSLSSTVTSADAAPDATA